MKWTKTSKRNQRWLNVLDKARIKRKIKINKPLKLALKAEVKNSGKQQKKEMRFLRHIGIEADSERECQRLRQTILKDYRCAKTIQVSYKGEKFPNADHGSVLKETPQVYVKDLIVFVSDCLDEYEEFDRPSANKGIMPDDEI